METGSAILSVLGAQKAYFQGQTVLSVLGRVSTDF